MSDKEKNWLVLAARCDYNQMMKALQGSPDLAPYADFLRGYTALHYAAKNGKLEIIKLLAGKYKVDVDRRTVMKF